MAVWIVLPTYNEAENIGTIVGALRHLITGDILVVDDGSPDGTGRLVEGMAATDRSIHLLQRSEKLGLGSAYRQGFQYALDRGATVVVQMDADGSHDPTLVPAMVEALDRADLVLGSRYVAGGKFPIAWYRRWISVCGNVYIRLLLGWSVRDWSTGFKAWRADVLPALLAQPPQGHGYAWLMEMTWLARRSGLRIVELPLVFRDRQAGRSKFSWRIALEDLSLAWRLARQRPTLVRKEKT